MWQNRVMHMSAAFCHLPVAAAMLAEGKSWEEDNWLLLRRQFQARLAREGVAR